MLSIQGFKRYFTDPILPIHFEEDRSRIIIFRKYLAIMFVIFTLGLITELTLDFKLFEWWTFATVQFECALFFTLSILNVRHGFVLGLNVISILVSNQITLLSNP